jgi:dextranase
MKYARLLPLLLVVLLRGGFVYAVETTIAVVPDKSFYRPGETVTLRVQAAALQAADGSRVEGRVTYLAETIAELNAPLVDGEAELTWQPPNETPRGYGLELTLLDENGGTLATASTAFDVLDHWIQAPRYGFFSDFTPGRAGDAETVDWLLRHHINGLQFYDWQYRWEDLLPDGDSFTDGMGRPLSMETVNHLIELVHQHNIAAMPYSAVYGASMEFYQQHPDWAMVTDTGELFTLGGFIAILDPTPGSPWNAHLLAKYADVLDNTAFDGIHIDQYGAPKVGFDAAGNRIDLAEVFPQFIDQTAELVQEKRGDDGVTIFNLVGNWPAETVAPSQEDAVYVEVWSPHNDYLDLNRIIANAQELGGNKPVIIAAYIPPERSINWHLSNAVIFASGGFSIETGEPHSLLADPYFPKYGTLNPQDEALLQRYYDFIVRYENTLSISTTPAADRVSALDLGDVRTGGIRSKGRIVPIVRAGEDFETFSLVNFVGIDSADWNQPTTIPPTPFADLPVTIAVTREVSRVWAASPDATSTTSAVSLPFTVNSGSLTFTLPQLDIWTMIVVEYADES